MFPLVLTLLAAAQTGDVFIIRAVDDETGRGIPLVELRTVHGVRYVTDSNGVVAFAEPGLMDRDVYFHVSSHGYEFPKDGFGYRGKALKTTPGATATLKLKRLNIAERLYRVTGAGIYRDSALADIKAPLKEPFLNAQVLGSDSVLTAVHRGKLHWFWGDTNRLSYPLGNFHVPGAVSELPGKSGLDPEVGVDLRYFVDPKGFAKATAKMPGDGPTWMTSLVPLADEKGYERLYASYIKIKPPMKVYARGIMVFEDSKEEFVHLKNIPMDAPGFPEGHSFRHEDDGIDYVYFSHPFPLVRVRATAAAYGDPASYEHFTPLVDGTQVRDGKVDRGDKGELRWRWRKQTPALTQAEELNLIKSGRMKPNEARFQLRDRDTGKPVAAHRGSVYWNEFRGRWIMIVCQLGGTSLLGEVWYAEAEAPTGPWKDAVKIVTHDRYSFYNPKHHPMLDKEGGRYIFFEGTYTHTFSGNPDQTPRYDYNQVMYKLDLAHPRLRKGEPGA